MNFEAERLSERYPVYTLVRSEKYGVGTKAHLRMRNLSLSGARFEVLKALDRFKRGEILRLIIELDEVQSRRIVNAEVVWAQDLEFGVNFIKPDEVLVKLFRSS